MASAALTKHLHERMATGQVNGVCYSGSTTAATFYAKMLQRKWGISSPRCV